MADWKQNLHAQAGVDPTPAHPDSPAGSGGGGFFGLPGPLFGERRTENIPHPGSPAGRLYVWDLELPLIEVAERAAAVYRSITQASGYLPAALLRATGMELHAIVAGIVPGLLIFLGILCASTVLGAAAGAAIGLLAGGVGAIPGAVVGAEIGAQAGIALLNYLGLAFLAVYVGTSLIEAGHLAAHAVQRAWAAADKPSALREHEISAAAREYAEAIALVFRGVLQGVVAFLIARGTAAAASRVPELVSNLRSSKLGEGFAVWIEKNWKGLIENPLLEARGTFGGPGGAGASASKAGGASSRATASPGTPRLAARKPPISAATSNAIVATPKPNRPDPSAYLPKEYIDEHLAMFDGGVSKVMSAAPAGNVGPPGGTFTLPAKFLDDAVVKSGGDVAKMEKLLSLDPGTLGANPVRVDIPLPSGMRMPSGNELGANTHWIPGGFTKGGIPEVTIDPAVPGTYSATPLFPIKPPGP